MLSQTKTFIQHTIFREKVTIRSKMETILTFNTTGMQSEIIYCLKFDIETKWTYHKFI